MDKNLIPIIGWPFIILASLIIFVKGRSVYKLIRGSMIGKITEVLVYSTLVNVSCLGIISTLYILSDPQATYPIIAVFVIWIIVFGWALLTIHKVGKDAKKIIGPTK